MYKKKKEKSRPLSPRSTIEWRISIKTLVSFMELCSDSADEAIQSEEDSEEEQQGMTEKRIDRVEDSKGSEGKRNQPKEPEKGGTKKEKMGS